MIETERRSLDSLTADPQNAMMHPDDNLDAIRRSLIEFGQVEPLVVQRSSGRVIAGNGRLSVMREIGWQEAWCTVIDIDDLRATALGLAMNQTAKLARWDAATVLKLVGEIEASSRDLVQSIGFSEEELHKITNIAAKEERLALAQIERMNDESSTHEADTPRRNLCGQCPFRHGAGK